MIIYNGTVVHIYDRHTGGGYSDGGAGGGSVDPEPPAWMKKMKRMQDLLDNAEMAPDEVPTVLYPSLGPDVDFNPYYSRHVSFDGYPADPLDSYYSRLVQGDLIAAFIQDPFGIIHMEIDVLKLSVQNSPQEQKDAAKKDLIIKAVGAGLSVMVGGVLGKSGSAEEAVVTEGTVKGSVNGATQSAIDQFQQYAAEGKMPAIGKMVDLNKPGAVTSEDYKVADLLPYKGNPQADWKQNSSVLRTVMNQGVPIKDVSPYPMNNVGFLGMERNLLRNSGWT